MDDCKVIVPTDKFNNIPERVNNFFLLHHFLEYNSHDEICYIRPHHGSCICWECEECSCEWYSYEQYRECPCIHSTYKGPYPYNVENYLRKCKELEDKLNFYNLSTYELKSYNMKVSDLQINLIYVIEDYRIIKGKLGKIKHIILVLDDIEVILPKEITETFSTEAEINDFFYTKYFLKYDGASIVWTDKLPDPLMECEDCNNPYTICHCLINKLSDKFVNYNKYCNKVKELDYIINRT